LYWVGGYLTKFNMYGSIAIYFILMQLCLFLGKAKREIMDRIIIDVDPATASKWFTASDKLKSEIGKYMNDQIAAIIDKKEEVDIIQFLNELRREMEQRGLTQEILDDILKDE
jgi:hypothetical protein